MIPTPAPQREAHFYQMGSHCNAGDPKALADLVEIFALGVVLKKHGGLGTWVSEQIGAMMEITGEVVFWPDEMAASVIDFFYCHFQ